MDEEQLFAFDTWGFLTIEDALTPEQVAKLKATVGGKGPDLHSQHRDRGGFWSQDFVDLLDLPVVSQILEEIYGGARGSGLPPFRIDHINVHTHGTFNKDLAGGTIHGGNGRLLDPQRPHELVTHYYSRDPDSGAFANGLVTVAYELEDTVCNGGGFGCLAGSHKGHYPVPEAWRDLSKGVHPMVTRVPARAGTAIIFTEALCHVTLPWTVPSTRTTLFYKYTDRAEAYSGAGNFFSPSDADQWQGVDDRTRAILAPPPQDFVERKGALAPKQKR
ncbi:MAG: hypothetical protein GKR89_18160 [Candidatus Latescibacteria bacterium]|nr:hypothetical protein [Candidatus Latescibacterota bacterium]